MAERRMFAKTIIDSDAFLELPAAAQLLYFHLAMRADDDGFVNKPKSIARMMGCTDETLVQLAKEGFLILFDSGVTVIRHWRMHNQIRNDRHKQTAYQQELAQLSEDGSGVYDKCAADGIPVDNQLVVNVETQYRLGKDRLGKDRLGKDRLGKVRSGKGRKEDGGDAAMQPARRFAPPSAEEVMRYCMQRGNNIDPVRFVDYYESNGWMVGRNKMKDWKAAVRAWERKEKGSAPANPFLEMAVVQ